jgi:hypothetical protein
MSSPLKTFEMYPQPPLKNISHNNLKLVTFTNETLPSHFLVIILKNSSVASI